MLLLVPLSALAQTTAVPCAEPWVSCTLTSGRALRVCHDLTLHLDDESYAQAAPPTHGVRFDAITTHRAFEGSHQLTLTRSPDGRVESVLLDTNSCGPDLAVQGSPSDPPMRLGGSPGPTKGTPSTRATAECRLADGRKARIHPGTETTTYWFGRDGKAELTFSVPTRQVQHTWTPEASIWSLPNQGHQYRVSVRTRPHDADPDSPRTGSIEVTRGEERLATLHCTNGLAWRLWPYPYDMGLAHGCSSDPPLAACELEDGRMFAACADGEVRLGELSHRGPVAREQLVGFRGSTEIYRILHEGTLVTWRRSRGENSIGIGLDVETQTGPGVEPVPLTCKPGYR